MGCEKQSVFRYIVKGNQAGFANGLDVNLKKNQDDKNNSKFSSSSWGKKSGNGKEMEDWNGIGWGFLAIVGR